MTGFLKSANHISRQVLHIWRSYCTVLLNFWRSIILWVFCRHPTMCRSAISLFLSPKCPVVKTNSIFEISAFFWILSYIICQPIICVYGLTAIGSKVVVDRHKFFATAQIFGFGTNFWSIGKNLKLEMRVCERYISDQRRQTHLVFDDVYQLFALYRMTPLLFCNYGAVGSDSPKVRLTYDDPILLNFFSRYCMLRKNWKYSYRPIFACSTTLCCFFWSPDTHLHRFVTNAVRSILTAYSDRAHFSEYIRV